VVVEEDRRGHPYALILIDGHHRVLEALEEGATHLAAEIRSQREGAAAGCAPHAAPLPHWKVGDALGAGE
jgi:hypothetical protein